MPLGKVDLRKLLKSKFVMAEAKTEIKTAFHQEKFTTQINMMDRSRMELSKNPTPSRMRQ